MDHDPLCQFVTLNLVCQCVLIARVREDERDRIWNRGE
jgi:hypothetical protein